MRKHKGFTMIEMLVIVGCIAALVAIAYPKFSDMMEKNRENTDIVAMQSAHALLETAFDTGLLIDGRPITDATPAAPLYYDPSGKLTWQKPEGYGEGTDNPSGVTWSCCDDYEYNPAASYKGDFICCYYVAPGEGVTNSGLHVHWYSDKDSGNVPAPNPPVPTVTFPTVPEQEVETTEAAGGNGGDDKGDDRPTPTPEPSNVHVFPKRNAYGGLEGEIMKGHRYCGEDSSQIYVAVQDHAVGYTADLKSEYDFVPLNKPKSTDGKYPQVFYSSKNLWNDKTMVNDNTITEGGENNKVNLMFGDYFVLEPQNASGTTRYFVWCGVWPSVVEYQPGPIKSDGTRNDGWLEINMECELCKNTAGIDHFWE